MLSTVDSPMASNIPVRRAAGWRTDCVERLFSGVFQRLGRVVGKHPWWFFVTPLLISTLLGSGFHLLRDREANDIEDQFTPINGPAKLERQFVRENFPLNNSDFSEQRLHTGGVYASFIAVSRTSNILTKAALTEILSLDKKVRQINISIGHDEHMTFDQLCARKYNQCIPNEILDIGNYLGSQIEDTELTFPFFISGSSHIFLGYSVGGVKLDSTGLLKSAKAIRLFYFLQERNGSATHLWLNKFLRVFPSNLSLNFVTVAHFTSLSTQVEFEANTNDVIPLFSVTYVIAILFSILSCMRFDCVRNKAWVAGVGVLSAGLAVLSSFGLMLFIGVPFVMTVANSPFLILGIGVDDMFILISCWQQTNVHSSAEDRLAETYRQAAISITITTLTDALAFYIGLMTPFRSVRAFCLYSSTAILFCYVYSVTFLGAFLVLNGRRENSNKHWLTCKVVPRVCPIGRSKWYHHCCVGGAYDHQSGTEEVQPMSRFFKTHYGPVLTKPTTKACVILLYAVYLGLSGYGCFQIKEGIDIRHLVKDTSYVVRYYDSEKFYFTEYGPNVMVVVRGEFPYWDQKNVSELESCIEEFKNLSFIEEDIFTSWLKSYKYYGQQMKLNLSSAIVFKSNLGSFLRFHSDFKQDINFTNNSIHASRFFVQTVNISMALDEMNMVDGLRDIADRCPVPLLVYHPAFIYYDQYAVIVPSTVQSIGVTTAVMLVISLLLIPNPLCSLCVTFSIGSVIVGVTGFMALWAVNLDTISMIILVVCVGFTVDFAAHISYAFVSSQKASADGKAVDALFRLGCPVLQGATSTVLGVVVLSASGNYIFRTFFKIMTLVIIFGLLHGLTFIPVFLTFFDVFGGSSGEAESIEKTKTGDQTLVNGQPTLNRVNRASQQEKQIYENHTFLPDFPQILPTTSTLSIGYSTRKSHLLQNGQMCVPSTDPVVRIDSETSVYI